MISPWHNASNSWSIHFRKKKSCITTIFENVWNIAIHIFSFRYESCQFGGYTTFSDTQMDLVGDISRRHRTVVSPFSPVKKYPVSWLNRPSFPWKSPPWIGKSSCLYMFIIYKWCYLPSGKLTSALKITNFSAWKLISSNPYLAGSTLTEGQMGMCIINTFGSLW